VRRGARGGALHAPAAASRAGSRTRRTATRSPASQTAPGCPGWPAWPRGSCSSPAGRPAGRAGAPAAWSTCCPWPAGASDCARAPARAQRRREQESPSGRTWQRGTLCAGLQQVQLLLRPHERQRQAGKAGVRARGRGVRRVCPARARVRSLGLALGRLRQAHMLVRARRRSLAAQQCMGAGPRLGLRARWGGALRILAGLRLLRGPPEREAQVACRGAGGQAPLPMRDMQASKRERDRPHLAQRRRPPPPRRAASARALSPPPRAPPPASARPPRRCTPAVAPPAPAPASAALRRHEPPVRRRIACTWAAQRSTARAPPAAGCALAPLPRRCCSASSWAPSHARLGQPASRRRAGRGRSCCEGRGRTSDMADTGDPG